MAAQIAHTCLTIPLLQLLEIALVLDLCHEQLCLSLNHQESVMVHRTIWQDKGHSLHLLSHTLSNTSEKLVVVHNSYIRM